jgi:hypothetical protein
MRSSGSLLVLSYPDTFVKMSDEFICRVLPWVGLGTKEYIKAGHAALVLINNKSGEAHYYDFGRYITPFGYGRVRSSRTDAELRIPFKAYFNNNGSLLNIEDFLLWLDAHPEKTHGQGRLVASLCNSIDFNDAEQFILNLQKKGNIPYGAFGKKASNCSRFVADVLISSTTNRVISRRLKWNKLFTPSAIGNVVKSSEYKLFEVHNGIINTYNGSAFKENLKNYFHKNRTEDKKSISDSFLSANSQKLVGTGSSAWFELIDEYLSENRFRIRRYNDYHKLDFDGIFEAEREFDPKKEYRFTYDSNCLYCNIKQGDSIIQFKFVAPYDEISLEQKVHSA